jgi:hypothetical protein
MRWAGVAASSRGMSAQRCFEPEEPGCWHAHPPRRSGSNCASPRPPWLMHARPGWLEHGRQAPEAVSARNFPCREIVMGSFLSRSGDRNHSRLPLHHAAGVHCYLLHPALSTLLVPRLAPWPCAAYGCCRACSLSQRAPHPVRPNPLSAASSPLRRLLPGHSFPLGPSRSTLASFSASIGLSSPAASTPSAPSAPRVTRRRHQKPQTQPRNSGAPNPLRFLFRSV